MTSSEDVLTSSWCVMTPSLWSAVQHSTILTTGERSRDTDQSTGACDVIDDVVQDTPASCDDRISDSDLRQQQKSGRTTKRRIETSSSSSSSSGVSRKRQRYEYSDVQRRLLCNAYARKTTPSTKELDELTAQLRNVDPADRHLDTSNVRIWFQNRRREHRQHLASLSSASVAAAGIRHPRTRTFCPASSIQCPTSRDSVMDAVMRLTRYCSVPTDITNTLFSHSLPHLNS